MKKMGALFLYAILASFCIGIGGMVFLRLRDAFPGANVVGALFFTIGLFTICTRSYSLYTGRVCYLFDNFTASYALSIVVIWFGNLVGCMLVAWLQSLTSLVGPKGIDAVAKAMIEGRMNATYISLFVLGFFCNMIIFIAVNSFTTCPHESGKYIALFLGVAAFIIAGTEHSIADMYFWCISGEIYNNPSESFLRIFIITLGNAVGGFFLPVMETLKSKIDPPVVASP